MKVLGSVMIFSENMFAAKVSIGKTMRYIS